MKERETAWCVTASPVGPLRLGEDERGICSLEYLDAGAPLRPAPPESRWLAQAVRELEEYFAGERRAFTVPLSPEGTAFQKRVWAELRRIPWGETRSYGQIAAAIGQPGAARAVGMANNRNRLPIFIPCHRVVGADGSLVGYSDGLAIKRLLLELEREQE